MFSVQEYAVLLTGSSRTVSHQSHINMLDLTAVLDRYTRGFLSLFCPRAILDQSRTKPHQTQKVQFIKTTVTLNIQDARVHGRWLRFKVYNSVCARG